MVYLFTSIRIAKAGPGLILNTVGPVCIFVSGEGSIEDRLGYRFRRPEHLRRALTRKAYANEQRQRGNDCPDQEICSTLGDAVIRLVLVTLLIRQGCVTPDEITRMKRGLEREEVLAAIGARLGIGTDIIPGIGEEKQGARNEPYVLAETLEAVAGAIFVDGGYDTAEVLLSEWFGPYLQ